MARIVRDYVRPCPPRRVARFPSYLFPSSYVSVLRFFPVFSPFFPRATLPRPKQPAAGNEMLLFRKWRWNEDGSPPAAARTPSYHLIWYRLLTSALLVENPLSRRSPASPSFPSLLPSRFVRTHGAFCHRGTHRPTRNPFLHRAPSFQGMSLSLWTILQGCSNPRADEGFPLRKFCFVCLHGVCQFDVFIIFKFIISFIM